jgi:hypothetical protein
MHSTHFKILPGNNAAFEPPREREERSSMTVGLDLCTGETKLFCVYLCRGTMAHGQCSIRVNGFSRVNGQWIQWCQCCSIPPPHFHKNNCKQTSTLRVSIFYTTKKKRIHIQCNAIAADKDHGLFAIVIVCVGRLLGHDPSVQQIQ